MIVIVGFIIVIAGVLGGFSMAGGHAGALWHPSEIVTIGGASLGALIVMSSKKVLIDLFKGIMQAIKGSPFNRKMYNELFSLMYDLMKTSRKDGLLAIESHVSNPHESTIFAKYPLILKNHHVCEFP
jgi:chemotaxis protein MotA